MKRLDVRSLSRGLSVTSEFSKRALFVEPCYVTPSGRLIQHPSLENGTGISVPADLQQMPSNLKVMATSKSALTSSWIASKPGRALKARGELAGLYPAVW